MSDGYVFIDTETNGRGPRARVIEIALIQTSLTGERQKEFTALIRGTGYSGGKRLVAIHHITDEMIKNERDFKDVWVEISPMIQNRTLVAHNAIFDQGMINRELERIGESPIGDFLCTLKLARFLGLAYRKSAQSEGASGNLGALAARLGLDVKPDHRALADTRALAAVFWKMNAMYPQKVAEYTKMQQRSRLITKSPVNFADHNNETPRSFHQRLDVVINPTLDAGFILDIQSLLPDVPGDAFIIDMAKCDPTRTGFRDHQNLWFQRLDAYSKIAARAISHFWTTDGELIVALSEDLPERLANKKTPKSFHQRLDVVINLTLDAGFIIDIQSLRPDGDAFIIDMAKCDPTRTGFRDHQNLWFQRLDAYSKIAARAISHFWTTDGELFVTLSEDLPERNETPKSFHQGLDVVINPTLDAEIILDIQSLLPDVPDGDAFIIDMAKCDPTRTRFWDHQYLWFQRLDAYSKIAARAISHFWTTDGELVVTLSEDLPERLANRVMTSAHFSIEDTLTWDKHF